jgi:Rrf2 family transcriptional regulator, cysteine metabolism repressor
MDGGAVRVSRKGEYALRAMIDLSLRYGEGPVSVAEVSRRGGIPKEFLQQILLQLKQAGLVQSVRGASGGYTLIRPPEKITLAEVLREIDGPLAPLSCVSAWAHRTCGKERDCGLYSVMLDVRNAIADILENVTLADVCKRTRGELRQAGLEAARAKARRPATGRTRAPHHARR